VSIHFASSYLIVHFLVLNNLGEKNLFRFTVNENPRGFLAEGLCDYAKSLGRALKASVLLTKHYTKYLKGR